MKIGTHHGKFHADEVFAVAILKQLHPAATVIRSRDPEILSQCDIVVDVGRGKYDHHTTAKLYRENGIPFASAGLIWRDFGSDVVSKYGETTNVDSVVKSIDEKLIQAIDAVDNGVDLDRDARIRGISELVGGFNPPWNSSASDHDAFEAAVQFAARILSNQVSLELARLDATQIVRDAFAKRDRKEILVLETFCPWTDTLIELDANEEVLYVVFPDRLGQYRLQVVPKALGSFEARKPLPEAWAGTEGEELSLVSGIKDAVFCHPARFIAGATSKESMLQMAQMAVDAEPS